CVASEILQSLFERFLVRAYSLVVQFSKINFFRFNPSPLKGDLINIPHQSIRLQELFLKFLSFFRSTAEATRSNITNPRTDCKLYIP
ncbi:hypothetical protein M5X11_15385, partial [Paenibacillus alginolyticus]|uniref:hypothetical protein n=1 Tax=Paenibacillus alginolyticus TaxID=59839 RepID=UPI00228518C8